MRTCLVLAVIALINAGNGHQFPEYDEEYEDAKDKRLQLEKAKERECKEGIHGKHEEELNRPIYDLADAPQLFEKFIKNYDKKYKNEAEFLMRYQNFVNTLKEVNEVNMAGKSYTSDINLFADVGDEEFEKYTGVLN